MIESKVRIISIAFFVFCCGTSIIANDLIVTLSSSEAKVSGTTVTIADIATVKSSRSSFTEAVGKLDLEVLENEGDESEITKRQVELRILVSGIAQSVQMKGVDKVVVERSAKFHPRQIVNQSIIKAVSKQFDIAQEDIRVSTEASQSTAQINELANAIQTAILILPDELPMGSASVQFIFQNDQGIDKEISVKCQVTITKEMLVARKDIQRGKRLSSEDVRLVRRPMSNKKLKPAALKQVIGNVATKDIPSHAIVQTTHLYTASRGQIIRRNDTVKIIRRVNNLRVELQEGKALNSGNIGDRIKVSHPYAKNKTLVAYVLDESTVEVR